MLSRLHRLVAPRRGGEERRRRAAADDEHLLADRVLVALLMALSTSVTSTSAAAFDLSFASSFDSTITSVETLPRRDRRSRPGSTMEWRQRR